MATTMYAFVACAALLCTCSGQPSPPQSGTRLEEPKQTLEEVRSPQTWNTDRQQAPLDTSYLPDVEERQLVDRGETQLNQAKDDLTTDEHRFWGYRPYSWRRWGGGWNGYRGWRGYDYGRRYPYFYGYYW
ncbi:hypothetical protein L798_03078 [Zootermopsis nevadensis]|uniref:Uncharacterized protein n=2 Tax=Zootermopsis nevadensis TaxID=136037 RepID=A0A067RQN0_ZOONE|nr:hypothetical protein L798_03078 [Zootermopsis nevadensis]